MTSKTDIIYDLIGNLEDAIRVIKNLVASRDGYTQSEARDLIQHYEARIRSAKYDLKKIEQQS